MTEELSNLVNKLITEKMSLAEQEIQGMKQKIQSLEEHVALLDASCGEQTSTKNAANAFDDAKGNNPRNMVANYTEKQSLTSPQQRSRRAVGASAHISFTAYQVGTMSNMVPGQAVRFNHVLHNDGDGYNTYTGAFTAPVNGTYMFTFHFDSRVHTFVRLVLDGRNLVDAVANQHPGAAQMERETMSGNTAIVHVNHGQAVIVEVYDVNGEVASSDKYRLINSEINAKDVTIDKTNELILTLYDVIYELKGRLESLETKVTKLRHENNGQVELIEKLRTEIIIKGNVLNRELDQETNKRSLNNNDDFNNSGTRVISEENNGIAGEPSISFQTLPRARRALANVAFSAYLSHPLSHVTNKALLNDGNGYNASTGTFTAPLSGVYMFNFHFDSRALSFLKLVIDGVNQVDAVANRHVLNDFNDRKAQSMGGNTCIVHVNHGQVVQLRVYETPNSDVASGDTFRLSTFSGVLLY
ncbi:uncharacterized protein LOC128226047 [Mya arenaria]|uniref:uncharacterized protein LOC128226047 n=1 Tax=Mya arenaria TaxID=6604 RepID=UPI0022E964F8|nr:uncharacterized protein LOC128226047 [Mya arenaria]